MQTRIEEVFSKVVELDQAEQFASLRRLCGDDELLYQEVESLLAAARDAQEFLATQPVVSRSLNGIAADLFKAAAPDAQLNEVRDRCATEHDHQNVLNTRLGAYQLVREIGRGGMGVVYLACRADGQYEQQVAIKLMRRDIDTDKWAGRFETEKQILADLRHENIAQLIDGGTSKTGQSYLVMEYVEGIPVHRYCQLNNLSLNQRLEIFVRICRAISFAHQNLIIHRDLKPDNVLVTPDGAPKLLDFGVAKLTSCENSMTGMAQTGIVPFTPEYAAPEQLSGSSVTTSTDVYALGVILFEMLSGARPFRLEYSLSQYIDAVITSDTPEPSRLAPADLVKQIRGDLDNIVLKALSKEPGDRYASADLLIADIEDFVQDRPVRASSSNTFYRLKKYISRNRLLVISISLVIGVLMIGIMSTHWQWQIARDQRDAATQRYNDVRNVVNTMVFQLPNAIQGLSGAMPVRAKIVDQGVAHMDILFAQQPNDPKLLLDLAKGYLEIAKIQGSPVVGNIGAPLKALDSLGKAEQLLEKLTVLQKDDPNVALSLAVLYGQLALMYGVLVQPDLDRAIAYTRRCVDALKPFEAASSAKLLTGLAYCYLKSSHWHLKAGDGESAARSLAVVEKIVTRIQDMSSEKNRDNILHIKSRLNEDYAHLASMEKRWAHALSFEENRLTLISSLTKEFRFKKTRLLAFAYHGLGARQAANGFYTLAESSFKSSVDLWRKIHTKNPVDVSAIQSLAVVQAEMAQAYLDHSRSVVDISQITLHRQKVCDAYHASLTMLRKLSNPRSEFPRRYLWSPTPVDIIDQANTHCADRQIAFKL